MSEAAAQVGPFALAGSTNLQELLGHAFEEAQSAGLPCSYISLVHTKVERGNEEPLERLLINLEGSDVLGELEQIRVARSHDGSICVTTMSKTWFRQTMPHAEAVLERIRAEGLERLCERDRWYSSDSLVTGDWNYWIDSANPWPAWRCSLGCDIALTDEGPPGGRGGDGGLSSGIGWAAKVFGGTVGLMPFVAVRVMQDLIRLDPGRLRRLDSRTEQAIVPFALGNLGWSYAQNNKPELRFKLLGENHAVVHGGTLKLGSDELKYGAFLMVPEGVEDRRIFGTDLELLLNGTVVDRSQGAYIRSIKVSVKLGQG